ncbi:MAG: hypothetical protein V1727_06095 [Candidatus Omnitrophota bacterium]
MLQGRHPPPEKQLLNLIEQAKVGKNIAAGLGSKRFGWASFFSAGGLRGRFSFYKSKANQSLADAGTPNIKAANRALELSVLALAVYLVSSFALGYNKLHRLPSLDALSGEGTEAANIEAPSLLRKLPYYLEKARGRDIFSPLTQEKVEQATLTDEQSLIKTKIAQAQEAFSLVGIGVSRTGEPDAMIKDTLTDRVYFLKRGDTIKDFKVQAIFKDSVVLAYEGEELILK